MNREELVFLFSMFRNKVSTWTDILNTTVWSLDLDLDLDLEAVAVQVDQIATPRKSINKRGSSISNADGCSDDELYCQLCPSN